MRKRQIKSENKKRMRLLYFVVPVVLVFFLVLMAMCINSKPADNAKEYLTDSIGKDVALYASGYIVSNDTSGEGGFVMGEKRTLIKEEDAALVAESITKKCNECLSGSSAITNTQIKELTKYAAGELEKTDGIKGMSDDEYDRFMVTIECLVTADVYKAISQRGLVSTSDLETLRKGLETRLTSLDNELSETRNDIANNVSYINQIVNAISGGTQGTLDGDLNKVSGEMQHLRSFLALYEKGSVLTSTDYEYLYGEMVRIEKALQEATVGLNSSVDMNSYIDSFNSLISSLNENKTITDEEIKDIQNIIERIEKECSLSDNTAATFIEKAELIESLQNEIDSQQVEFEALQTNLITLAEQIKESSKNVSGPDGSSITGPSDEQVLIDLCNMVAEQVAAATISSNSELKSQILDIQNTISALQNDLSTSKAQTESVKASVITTLETMQGALSDIENISTSNLYDYKTLLMQTKGDIAQENTSSAEELRTNIDAAIRAIENTIQAKSDSDKNALVTAKEELTSAITSLNSSLDSEVTDLQTQINNTSAELEAAKQALTLSLTALSENLSSLQDRVTYFEKQINERVDTKYNELSSALTDKTDELNALKASKTELDLTKTALEDADTALCTALQTTEESLISDITNEAEARTRAIADAENARDALQRLLQDNIDSLNESTSSALDLKVASLTSAINEAKTDASTSLNTVKSTLESSITAVTAALSDDIGVKLSSLDEAIADTNTSITSLKTNLENTIQITKSELIGAATDTSSSDTITGAKKYADDVRSSIGQDLTQLQADVEDNMMEGVWSADGETLVITIP